MNIDLSRLPSTLDALHVILGLSAIALLFLQVLLLTFTVIVLLRRSAKEAKVPVLPVERPAQVVERKAEAKPILASKPMILREPTPDAALQLLSLFQAEARLLDFLQEDISAYSDAEIGAAARIVHEGCRKVLQQHFDIVPVRSEQEGSRITIPQGFDPSEIRLTGHVVGTPPFSGVLVHRGWRVVKTKLPQLIEGHKVDILAPAEVEL